MLYTYYYIFIATFVLWVSAQPQPGRYDAAAVLTDTKVVFFGGFVFDTNSPNVSLAIDNSLFLLDISQSWQTQAPAWAGAAFTTGSVLAPYRAAAEMVLDNNFNFWVYGGLEAAVDLNTNQPVTIYNSKTFQWSIPSLTATMPKQLIFGLAKASAVMNDSGVIFYYGGLIVNSTGQFLNEAVVTLDTVSQNWATLPVGNGPLGIIDHAATIVK